MKKPAFLTKKEAPTPPVKGAFTISGHIKDENGPLEGVEILLGFTSDAHTIKTGANGFYTTQPIPPGVYTVIPRLLGYFFDPFERKVDVKDDIPGIDFIGMIRLPHVS